MFLFVILYVAEFAITEPTLVLANPKKTRRGVAKLLARLLVTSRSLPLPLESFSLPHRFFSFRFILFAIKFCLNNSYKGLPDGAT